LSSFAAKGERRVEAQTSSSPPTLSIHSPPSFFIISTLQMKPRHTIRPSSPLPFLPPEMKQHILRFCDPSTLAKASRVSLAFLELSSPILYQDIELIGLVSSRNSSAQRVGNLSSSRVSCARGFGRGEVSNASSSHLLPPSLFSIVLCLLLLAEKKRPPPASPPSIPIPLPKYHPRRNFRRRRRTTRTFNRSTSSLLFLPRPQRPHPSSPRS